jgi:pimeloyl-ACP methyl ester carboxylesterase
VSLVGWSTGGFVALNLASRYPDRVERLLVIAGFARGRLRGSLGALQKVTRHGHLGRWTFRQVIRCMQKYRNGFEFLHRWNAADLTAYHQSASGQEAMAANYCDFRRYDPETLCRFFDQLRGLDISSRLGEIRCPTTIAAGTRDPIIPFEHTRQIARMIPRSRIVTWEGCGHIFFSERTGEFQHLLRNWLGDQNHCSQVAAVA